MQNFAREDDDVVVIVMEPGSSCQKSKDSAKADEKTAKIKYCLRCRNHGVRSALKGHKHFCRFQYCSCPLCSLLSKRQLIAKETMAVRRKIERAEILGYKFQEEGAPSLQTIDQSTGMNLSINRQDKGMPGSDTNQPVPVGWHANLNAGFSYHSMHPNVLHYSKYPGPQIQFQPITYPRSFPLASPIPYNPSSLGNAVQQISPRGLSPTTFFGNEFSLVSVPPVGTSDNHQQNPHQPQQQGTIKQETFRGPSPMSDSGHTQTSTVANDEMGKTYTELRAAEGRSCMYQPVTSPGQVTPPLLLQAAPRGKRRPFPTEMSTKVSVKRFKEELNQGFKEELNQSSDEDILSIDLDPTDM